MKKRALSIIAVLALLIAAMTVTALAAETPATSNDVSKYASETLSTELAPTPINRVGTAYCPVCKETVSWYSQGSSGDQQLDLGYKHWFIQGPVSNTGTYSVKSSKACFYLNGYSVSSTKIAFAVEAGATLNIIGNGTEGETVSGTGDGGYGKGSTINVNGGTVNLYGGTYTKQDTVGNAVIGLPVANATLNVYNGTTVTGGTSTRNGGNICLTGNPTRANLYGGTVSNGSAYGGGNIYAETGGVVVVDGATISGGTATGGDKLGGNIGLYNTSLYFKSGSITGGSGTYGGTLGLYAANLFQTGGTFTGGSATNGGSIYGYNGAIVEISAGTLTGGKASSQGGNIMLNGGQLKISGTAQITNGEASVDGGNIYVWGGNTTTITGGTISGGKAENRYGGNLVVENAKVTVSGGTISGGKAADGGNIYTFASATGSYGLVIEGSAVIQNGTANYGGNIVNKGTITANGGSISGGSATNGGSLYIGSGSTANLTGMTISDGSATAGMGGNFYVAKANLTLNNCSVSGGKATSWGGNMYADTQGCVVTIKGTTTISGGNGNMGGNIAINDKAELKIESGEISGGTAPNYGGNIYMHNGTLTQTGGTVKNGTSSTDRGGNIYIASGVTANITGATYEGGKANVYGGNIFNNGTLTVTNTSITGGNAARGGNVHCASGASFTNCTIQGGSASYGGNIRIDSTAQCTFTKCTVKNGTASSGGGNMDARAACTFNDCTLEVATGAGGNGSQFYNEGTQTFNGCTLTNGTVMGDGNIVLNNTIVNMSNLDARINSIVTLSGNTQVNKMTVSAATCGIYVKKDFTGEVNFASMVGTPDAPVYGKELGAKYTAEGDFTGKVIPTFTLEEPWVCNSDGKLVFAACRTVKNGEITWYADGAQAQAAYDGTGYLWPAADGTIPVNGTCTVDLAGTNQTITGTGTVTIFDSANADFKTYGTATVNGPAVANAFATEVEGNTYYMIANGNTYTFHRLENKITGVTLRPSVAGIYYTSVWSCDDALAQLIQSFGVAVNLKAQPAADFQTTSLYTAFQPSEFESGVNKNSVLVANIFSTEAEDNAVRGKQSIYASSYVTFANGETAYHAVETGKHHSLHDVLSILEANSNDYAAHAATLENFMTKWSQYGVTGDDWNFDFTVAPEIVTLNSLYAGLNAYQGEMHDHANTGGRSDGKQTLRTWIDGMKKLKMDFATIVDHDQSRHMYLDEWDDATFIGGTETTGWLTGKATVSYGEFHMNLIFATVEQFEAFIEEYNDVFMPQRDPETGAYIFKPIPEGFADKKDSPEYLAAYRYLPASKEYLMELATAVHKHGGFFAHVHPKQAMQSTDIEDYWFGDFTGLEVQYTYLDGRNGAKPQANYQLWTDLLAAGKKIYATAGNDEHNMPTVKALTTIYAPENTAVSLVEQMREGNFNPGPVGIRMAIGDTKMGGVTDFTGKKLAFVIGNIHESELADGEHNYRVDLYKGSELVQSWDMPATGENFYQVVDIDADADFYRLEVIDVEGDTIDRVALSQPIWNEK